MSFVQKIKTPHQRFLLTFWVGMQLFVGCKFGINSGCDTQGYIDFGQQLFNGNIGFSREFLYISYGAVLAFFKYLNLNVKFIVLIQVIASYLAMVCVYDISKNIFQSKTSGLIASLFYVFWFKIHEWNFFLYTESLYTSFSIFVIWFLVSKKITIQNVVWFIVVLTFTIFIRPSSVSLILGLLVYGLINIYKNVNFKWFSFIFVSSFLVFLFGVNTWLQFYDLIPSYLKAEIIYPNISLGVSCPDNVKVMNRGIPLFDLMSFIVCNPIYFGKLFLIKWVLFYTNVKPYFSVWHNAFIVVFLSFVYVLTFGVVKYNIRNIAVIMLLSIILCQGLIVGLTTENWDGRFLIPILPLFFILSSGNKWLIQKVESFSSFPFVK